MRATVTRRLPAWMLVLLPVTLLATGCSQIGAMMYFAGVGQNQKTPAEYQLPKKPLLILVDDDFDLIHPPIARDVLMEAVAQQLREHELADKITSSEELAKIRQVTPDFDKVTATGLGKKVNAEVVLWLQVTRFTLPDELEAAVVPSFFGVSVKVLDVKATKRDEVRLWPKEREGKVVEATISPHELQNCKNVREAHTVMAQALAVDVAKLFYEYETDEKDSGKQH